MRVRDRFSAAWSAFLGRPSREIVKAQEELVSMRRELADVRLDLRGARETLTDLRSRLEELESGHDDYAPDDRFQELLEDLAAPLSQLGMQHSLMEAGKDIAARNIMVLVKQLAEIAEKAGLEPISRAGEEILFDTRIAEPLAADTAFSEGEIVVTKFNGYRYRGRIVRKALVAKRH